LGSLVLVALATLLAAACNVADTQLVNTPVPSLSDKAASFDVIQIDQQNQRLYVSDRTDKGIDVFDISTARASFLQTIAMSSSPNGLAIAPDLGRLFVGTSSGLVIVDIDPKSPANGTAIKEIATGTAADLLDYAPSRHLVFAGNTEGTISSIDATTGQVKGLFKTGQALEQPRFNQADGMLYVTSPAADALFRIDPDDGTIKTQIPFPKCQPSGLAINPRANQALIACAAAVVSWDFRTGKSQKFDKVPRGDVVTYDAKIDRFFVAAPKAKPSSVVGIFGGNPIAYVTSVVTSGGGNSAAYDETNNTVYTPETRIKKAGLTSFPLPADDQVPTSFVTSLGILVALLAGVGVLLFLLARTGDPIRRHAQLESQEASGAPH
jgi:6-phosphogluconolactonase (cycloisomerase 2 family)